MKNNPMLTEEELNSYKVLRLEKFGDSVVKIFVDKEKMLYEDSWSGFFKASTNFVECNMMFEKMVIHFNLKQFADLFWFDAGKFHKGQTFYGDFFEWVAGAIALEFGVEESSNILKNIFDNFYGENFLNLFHEDHKSKFTVEELEGLEKNIVWENFKIKEYKVGETYMIEIHDLIDKESQIIRGLGFDKVSSKTIALLKLERYKEKLKMERQKRLTEDELYFYDFLNIKLG